MENVAPAIYCKSHQDVCDLAGAEIAGLFPARVIWTGPAAVGENLKVNHVEVQGMVEIGLKTPDFGAVQFGASVHARRIVGFAVDPPAMRRALIAEIEIADDQRLFRPGGRDFRQLCGNGGFVALTADHVESHNLTGGPVSGAIQEGDARAHGNLRKIHDDVETFGWGEFQ